MTRRYRLTITTVRVFDEDEVIGWAAGVSASQRTPMHVTPPQLETLLEGGDRNVKLFADSTGQTFAKAKLIGKRRDATVH